VFGQPVAGFGEQLNSHNDALRCLESVFHGLIAPRLKERTLSRDLEKVGYNGFQIPYPAPVRHELTHWQH
jgi:hypothetical protein